jgi:hypothetical protein
LDHDHLGSGQVRDQRRDTDHGLSGTGRAIELTLTVVTFCGMLTPEVRLVTPGDSGHLRWSSFRCNSGRTD